MIRKLFGNAGIFLAANIVNAGIPFLLLPFLTRVLTPADYGVVAMFGVMVSLFGAFTGLSVHGAVAARYFELDKLSLARYVGGCLIILAVSTIAVFLVVGIFGKWLVKPTGVPFEWLLAAVLVSGAQFIVNVKLTLWQVSRAAKKYGSFQVLQGLTNAGCSLVLIFGFLMVWEGRVLGQIFAVLIFGSVALFWLIKSKEAALPSSKEGAVGDALRFGVPLIPHVVGGLVMVVADRFVIANMLGVESVGIYTLALQFGLILGLVADAFVKVYGPWLYGKLKENTAGSRMEIVGVTYLVWLCFLLMALMATFFCKLFFTDMVGAEFLRAQEIVFWFFLGQMFKGMYFSIAGFFFFSSRTSNVSIVTIFTGVFSIVATMFLVKLLGIKGAAMAYALSESVLFLLAWLLSWRVYSMPWFEVFSSMRFVLKRSLSK
ncbi:oligosaccharide flippase family protein [Pseudomonas beijingensis]|jgi:O-antigen/teichoic acid export membrane protein|uniref:Oligosaccharide flippase family protein n=1 Tax=Pseudomonas beijingensis TaxID=2954101 RepID=A0ABY9FH24_9PSED|nr:oligosaccharide flippase family protein [Pseudomonas sp. FP2034]WLH02848.1 oligosaccharide flippase family protein [Pseudomonas sp. FP2034]